MHSSGFTIERIVFRMETRFAFLHQRDTSVSMLRVKMSRRRSQSQKENREKVLNLRRRLEDLPEQDMSVLEKSVAVPEEKVSKVKAVKTGEPCLSASSDCTV